MEKLNCEEKRFCLEERLSKEELYNELVEKLSEDVLEEALDKIARHNEVDFGALAMFYKGIEVDKELLEDLEEF
jgi:hypothetical protein